MPMQGQGWQQANSEQDHNDANRLVANIKYRKQRFDDLDDQPRRYDVGNTHS